MRRTCENVAPLERHIGKALGARLELVRWDSHAVPDSLNPPQDSLNRQIVDDCDFGIAVFHARLGTPTDKADSGSVEEIERLTESGIPVMPYFSSAPVEQSALRDDQFCRLVEYRERVRASSLAGGFNDPEDLAKQVQLHVTSTISSMIANERGAPTGGKTVPVVLSAPTPDVRVRVCASLVVPRTTAEVVLQVSVRNYSPVVVHIASIVLECGDRTNLFIRSDAVTGRLNSSRSVEPGKSADLFFSLEDLKQALERTTIVRAVATDGVGRSYRSGKTEMQKVLRQLKLAPMTRSAS